MSYQPKFYKPVFLQDAVASINDHVSCYGTVLTIRYPSASNKPVVFTIDDGTCSIPAVFFDTKQIMVDNIDIGDDVIVYGYAQIYREEIQFKCDRVKFVQDTNIQTLWINQVLINKKRSNNKR